MLDVYACVLNVFSDEESCDEISRKLQEALRLSVEAPRASEVLNNMQLLFVCQQAGRLYYACYCHYYQ